MISSPYQKIALDTIEKEDLVLMRKWRNDALIWQWCRQNDLITESAHLSWFDRQSKDPSTKMYAIKVDEKIEKAVHHRGLNGVYGMMYKQVDETFTVGICGLTSIDSHNRRAEFSLYISPEHQRKGYARSALNLLLIHGFRNLGLNVIWGETFEGNPAMKLFESLGFKHEGTRRQFYFKNGKFIDAHLISITAGEYLK